jgi:hypothetical protein
MTKNDTPGRFTRRTALKTAGAGLIGAAALGAVQFDARPALAALVHPGLLHTAADVSRMATQVSAGVQPWQAGWARLTANSHASSTWTPNPLATVYRGSGTPENYGTLYNDIAAAYQNALRWKVTGIGAYGNTARDILNAWSATLTKLDGTADRFIASGIYGYEFANAAELMRGYSGFDLARFQTMMRNVFYPLNNDFLINHNGAYVTNYWASWDLGNVASILAIGVLCDDQAKIDQAVNYLKTGAGMGTFANAIPYVYSGAGLAQWQESGRDQGHTMLGIGLLGAICEMAWNQGIDLYGYDDNRFLKACEYVARYNLGETVPFTSYTWVYGQPGVWGGSQTFTEVSTSSRGDLRPIWEMLYNHYAIRRGLFAPNTAAFARLVRPEGGGGDYGPNSGGYDQLGFGTLTATRVATTTITAGNRSLQSANYPARWIRHHDGLAFVEPVDSGSDTATKQSATFTVVPGLAGSAGYSFQTSTGQYLRHFSFRLQPATSDGSQTFNQDATFYPVPGTSAGSIRLISHNFPGRCIRHRNFELWVDPMAMPAEDPNFATDSAFLPLNPWA